MKGRYGEYMILLPMVYIRQIKVTFKSATRHTPYMTRRIIVVREITEEWEEEDGWAVPGTN